LSHANEQARPPEPFESQAEGLLKRAKTRAARRCARRATPAKALGSARPTRRRKQAPPKMLYGWAPGIAAVIAVLFVVSRVGGDNHIQVEAPTAQAVSVVTVETRTFSVGSFAQRRSAPRARYSSLRAQASGVRILQILVDEGDFVRRAKRWRGSIPRSPTHKRARRKRLSAEAESSAVRARGEYERAESIRDSGALSAEAIEQRRAAALAADARLAAARAQLRKK
jgi:HlyD family secretion protein